VAREIRLRCATRFYADAQRAGLWAALGPVLTALATPAKKKKKKKKKRDLSAHPVEALAGRRGCYCLLC